MPLQRFDNAAVPRPPGMVAAEVQMTGITEIRLHGVGGTTPEDQLGDSYPQRVSGDHIAGFYRTADLPGRGQIPDRHVEAYSWGGLTSRSGTRVLWVLLFPFALANVAGWMCTPFTLGKPLLFWFHRSLVRWSAFGITLNFLLVAALTGMDLIAYQCGGRRACAEDLWWPLDRLGMAPLVDRPALRILLGAMLPLAVVALLAILTLRSINRYEAVPPTFKHVEGSGRSADEAASAANGALPKRSTRSAAAARRGLANDDFWDGQRSTLHLGCLHIAGALALVAVLLGYTVRETAVLAAVDVARPELWTVVLVAAGLTVAVALVQLTFNSFRYLIAPALVAVALAAVAAAAWFAVAQPVMTRQPEGPLPGMQILTNGVLLAIIGTVGCVLLVALFGGWRRRTFKIFGPFMALVLSLTVINVVVMGTITRLADLLKPHDIALNNPENSGAAEPQLIVYFGLGDKTPYVTLVPVAALLLFAVVALVCYWLVGRSKTGRARIRSDYAAEFTRDIDPWYASTAEPDPSLRWTRWRRAGNMTFGRDWAARVARARLVAKLPRCLDWVLTGTAVGVVAVFILWVLGELAPGDAAPSPTWLPHWLETTGNWLVAAMPLAVILVLRRGWKSVDSRRHIGVIWDVITFWPRAYHALAPPCYAERAVPELQRRLWLIHDSRTDESSPRGRAVLVAHSQGSVIAAAALLQRRGRPPWGKGPSEDDVSMVTFGSPLRTLYAWGFPAYFNDDTLQPLLPRGPGTSNVRLCDWKNLYYKTDYIGREVGIDGVDQELADPITCWHVYAQPEPAPGRHSGYWADPKVWTQVDAFAWATGNRPSPDIPKQWGRAPVVPAED